MMKLLLFLLLLMAVPLGLLWSLNTLEVARVPYSLATWAATSLLMLLAEAALFLAILLAQTRGHDE